jgi:hypothetical protein
MLLGAAYSALSSIQDAQVNFFTQCMAGQMAHERSASLDRNS